MTAGGLARPTRGDVADADHVGIDGNARGQVSFPHTKTHKGRGHGKRHGNGGGNGFAFAHLLGESQRLLHRGANRFPLNCRMRPLSSSTVRLLSASEMGIRHTAAISSTWDPSGDTAARIDRSSWEEGLAAGAGACGGAGAGRDGRSAVACSGAGLRRGSGVVSGC